MMDFLSGTQSDQPDRCPKKEWNQATLEILDRQKCLESSLPSQCLRKGLLNL